MYNRVGDDPCTSGVSMCSSEYAQNRVDSIEDQMQTVGDINIFKQPTPYIWLATYDNDMSDNSFHSMISQCSNPCPPLNKISIKLEEYDVAFANVGHLPSMLYLQRKVQGYCFIKLYLIQRDQLIDLAIIKNSRLQCNYKMKQEPDFSFIDQGKCFLLDELLPYGYGVLIGDFENYPIYFFTNYDLYEKGQVKNVCKPSDQYIKDIFYGMIESFPNFSHDFLSYYINLKNGLQSPLSKTLISELRSTVPNPPMYVILPPDFSYFQRP